MLFEPGMPCAGCPGGRNEMICQKCGMRKAVTYTLEIVAGRITSLNVCDACFLPWSEDMTSRISGEARAILLRASREMTDPASARRLRPALLYFLLENESSIVCEAAVEAGIDPSRVREEVSSFLSGEAASRSRWLSTRGFTPTLLGARDAVQRMECDEIGPEHVFLGLIESPEPGDPPIMTSLCARAGEVEKILMAMAALMP
jgi:hypothetical protein